jgi:PAS domain S-box-containing protein
VPQIIPFLTVFSMGTMVGLMAYVMMTNTRTWLGRACFAMCLTSAIWALGLYNAMTHHREASRILWHQVSAFGWCLYPLAFLLFALEITRAGTPRRRGWLLVGTGAAGAVFLVLIWINPAWFIEGFDLSLWGWGMTKPADSVALLLCVLYMAVAGIVFVLMLLGWGWRTPYRRERKQAYLLAATGAFTVSASAVFDIWLPIRGIPTQGTAPMFSTVFFLALFFCAYRYRLLEPAPPVSAADVMRRVRDLMIILDREGSVIQMNVSARETLGYGVTELTGKPWTRVVPDMALPEETLEFSCETELLHHQGEKIPAQVTVSQRFNPDGDCVGMC